MDVSRPTKRRRSLDIPLAVNTREGNVVCAFAFRTPALPSCSELAVIVGRIFNDVSVFFQSLMFIAKIN